MSLPRFILLLFLVASISCAPARETTQSNPVSRTTISELISALPADNQEEYLWINRQIMKQESAGMHSLVQMLVAPGSGDDTQVRYAINGFTKYVSSNGLGEEKKVFEQVLIEELKGSHSDPVKSFMLGQLELIGSDKAVPVLQEFIGNQNLNEPAVHALRAIGTEGAERALLKQLPQIEETHQVAVIKALGDLQTTDVQSLLPFAEAEHWPLRKVTLYALANSGNSAAQNTLAVSVDTTQSYRKSTVQDYYLMLAQRIAEEGDSQQSSAIYREVLDQDFPVNVKNAALVGLVQIEKGQALNELFAAVESNDPELRATALRLSEALPGEQVTDYWLTKLNQLNPNAQADLIEMLGRRGDLKALPEIKSLLTHNNLEVRIAAIQALSSYSEEQVLPDLIEVAMHSNHPKQVQALKLALLQQPTKPLLAAVSEALPSAPENIKLMIIEIMAERAATDHLAAVLEQRHHDNEAVQLAVYQSLEHLVTPDDLPQLMKLFTNAISQDEQQALQQTLLTIADEEPDMTIDAVEGSFSEIPEEQKALLLGVYSGIGNNQALEAVVDAVKDPNDEVAAAAVSELAGWKNTSALPYLKEVINTQTTPHQGTALEGYIRLVTESKYSSNDKIEKLTELLAEDLPIGEKAKVIHAHASIPSTASLRSVAGYFSDSDKIIQQAAFRTAAEMLEPSYSQATDFDEVDKLLAVLESSTGAETTEQVEQFIGEQRRQQYATDEYTNLFNGEDLSGWTGDLGAYKVENGQIINRDGESGNLFTEDQYADFRLKFDFKLTPGANNGLGIRSPLEGNPAYDGMELQILDNNAERYADLQPYQYHGSIYGVVAAKKGFLNDPGEWNSQEVIARGNQIKVILNGETIVDADIEEFGNPETIDGRDHPGLLRERGHIGFLGHGSEVAFRNIRIQDLNTYYPSYDMDSEDEGGLNQPPEGFKVLFNGENLDGWKGLVGNPESRRKMSAEELAKAQQEANRMMHEHWEVRDGILYFDGEGESLATEKKYKDFEMLLDWKIEPGGDSGVYLRGSPQVQIWDVTEWPQGSGGLYNNQQNPRHPDVAADNPIGEWNSMRIKMIDDKVTVHLNNEKVVSEVTMENYWNRDIPIYPEEQIELQSHSTPLYFKNIFIRELPRKENLIEDNSLTGWQPIGGNSQAWEVTEGILSVNENSAGGGWLSTKEQYSDFKLELEYKLPEGGNSGVFIRAPHLGNPAYEGLEIQLLDDKAPQYQSLEPWQYTGSLYNLKAPASNNTGDAGEWQKMEIIAEGPRIKVRLNEELIINTSLVHFMDRVNEHPGLKRRSGFIGLQNHNTNVEFRNITLTEIK